MAFTPNYTSVPFSEETYNFKEHYDSNLYVVFPNPNFNISKGNTKPVFICYLKQKGEKYGDPLGAVLPNGYTVIFRVLDKANGITINQLMTNTDTHLGEWSYNFSPFDFSIQGYYEAQIIVANTSVENIIAKCRINVED